MKGQRLSREKTLALEAKRRLHPRQEVDFDTFFAIWAKMNNWKIPPFHLDILDYLKAYQAWENNVGVLQVFRGGAKSTIVGLFVVWMLTRDPTLRFLVLSADLNSSSRLTADCRAIITRHPLATHLRGPEEMWKRDKFSVVGSNDARNPSVVSHGVGSTITSARADWIIYDDVEVPKTTHNESMRYLLRQRVQESLHILVPEGRRLFIGTPHAHDSIYPEILERGATGIMLPLLINPEGEFPNIKGISRWPERFSDEDIANRQRNSTKGNFLSQYQLMPVAVGDVVFDPSHLILYNKEITFFRSQGVLQAKIGERSLASVSAFWDPSLSKARRDASVLSIVFQDTGGHYFIHRCYTLQGSPEEQCDQAKKYAEDNRVPLINVETNGVGAFLPQILLKAVRGSGIGVSSVFTTENKHKKIVETIETPLFAGMLHVHESVMKTPFITQLRDFHPNNAYNKAIKDDYLDSVASAIYEQPIRIGRGPRNDNDYSHEWWGEYGSSHEIQVDMVNL